MNSNQIWEFTAQTFISAELFVIVEKAQVFTMMS